MHTHLKGVLGHAGEAVVGGAGGDGADAELTDLIGLTELRDAFWFHHTCQAWRGERHRHKEGERERERELTPSSSQGHTRTSTESTLHSGSKSECRWNDQLEVILKTLPSSLLFFRRLKVKLRPLSQSWGERALLKLDIDEKERPHIDTPSKLILRFNGLNGLFAIQCVTTMKADSLTLQRNRADSWSRRA